MLPSLWHHGIPAIGLPGATSWSEERDASAFDSIQTIYIVIEPDRGGEAVRTWLATSSIRRRARLLVMPEAVKDVSELHLTDPTRFRERWDAICRAAQPWSEAATTEARAEAEAAWALCHELAGERRILDRFGDALEARGTVGEGRGGKLLFLVIQSRLLDRVASAKVVGVSSVGKSSLVEAVLAFFPAAASYALTAMSERALAYSQEPLTHRMLTLFEAAGLASDFANYLVRSLLSEGHVKYETVEKTREGLRARLIERPGPTGLLTTSTKVKLHEETETRLLAIPVNDTPEQTRAVMRAEAQQFGGTAQAGTDFETWHALQRWLASAEHRIVVPFAAAIAELIPPVAVRLRRDFKLLLTLIQACALLHRASRERDSSGAIIATIQDDYATVRDLVHDLFAENVGATVSATTRQTVQAVRDLQPTLAFTGDRAAQGAVQGVTITDLARALEVDTSTAWRRAEVAIERGFLRNLELHDRRPAQLRTTAALPAHDTALLPTPDEVCAFARKSVTGDHTPLPSQGGCGRGSEPALPPMQTNAQIPQGEEESSEREEREPHSASDANLQTQGAEGARVTLPPIQTNAQPANGHIRRTPVPVPTPIPRTPLRREPVPRQPVPIGDPRPVRQPVPRREPIT